MKFQKKILATAIAAVGLGGPMAANAIALSPSGAGEALLVPYYSAVNGNKTFLSITNTHDNAKAVKVRFREGVGSRDVFDFTLYLSAFDVWTGLVFTSGDRVTVATQDASCTVPDVGVGNGSFSTTRIPAEYAGNVLERISEGHIEILEMAVLVADGPFGPIGNAVTHVNGVPDDCDLVRTWTAEMAQKQPAPADWNPSSVDAPIRVGQQPLFADTSSGLQDLLNPTGGLYAHAAVFNPTDGTYFTYAADALVGWADGILWFPQNSTGREELNVYTTDQGLAWDEGEDDNGFVEYFDLPDLSTPALAGGTSTTTGGGSGVTFGTFSATKAYVAGTGDTATLTTTWAYSSGSLSTSLVVSDPDNIDPDVTLALGSPAAAAKRNMVTSALLHNALVNDYVTGGAFETEWLVTFPSRYLHVNASGGVDANGDDLPDWAAAAAPFTQVENARTGEACEEIVFEYWDREESQVSDPGSIDFSPGGSTPDKFQLCYEVNVMAFNQDAGASSTVLRSASIAKYVGLADGYDNGWAALDFSGFSTEGNYTWYGLPSTGFSAIADTSGDVARGATFRHHQANQVASRQVPD